MEAWQNRPLAASYPIVYLDAIHLKLRRDGKVLNTAVYVVLGVDLEGQRDVLGHWVGDGAEGANFSLYTLTIGASIPSISGSRLCNLNAIAFNRQAMLLDVGVASC